MSSSCSGKLQKAIRSWRSSGIGWGYCSTNSKGMELAASLAANSSSLGTLPSNMKNLKLKTFFLFIIKKTYHPIYFRVN